MKLKRLFSGGSTFGWLFAAGAIAIISSPTVRRKLRKYAVRGTAMLMEMTDRLKQGTKNTIAPAIPVKEKFEFNFRDASNTTVAKTDLPNPPSSGSTGMFTVELTKDNEEKREET
jgi:hypothetical protein